MTFVNFLPTRDGQFAPSVSSRRLHEAERLLPGETLITMELDRKNKPPVVCIFAALRFEGERPLNCFVVRLRYEGATRTGCPPSATFLLRLTVSLPLSTGTYSPSSSACSLQAFLFFLSVKKRRRRDTTLLSSSSKQKRYTTAKSSVLFVSSPSMSEKHTLEER